MTRVTSSTPSPRELSFSRIMPSAHFIPCETVAIYHKAACVSYDSIDLASGRSGQHQLS